MVSKVGTHFVGSVLGSLPHCRRLATDWASSRVAPQQDRGLPNQVGHDLAGPRTVHKLPNQVVREQEVQHRGREQPSLAGRDPFDSLSFVV